MDKRWWQNAQSSEVLVVIGLVAGAWWLWHSDAALNALILFCTAGVVPITGKVLTPEQMYLVMGGVLLVSVCVIFSRRLVHDLRAIHHAISTARLPSQLKPKLCLRLWSSLRQQSLAKRRHKSKAAASRDDLSSPASKVALAKAVHYIAPRIWPAITLAATIAAKIISRMSRHAVAWVRRTSITLIIG